DRAAQSSIRNVLTTAKACFTDQDSYTAAGAVCNSAKLQTSEPSLSFGDHAVASTGPNSISVLADSANVLYLAALSKSGTCFTLKDNEGIGGGVTYDGVTHPPATCTADAAKTATVTGPTW